MMVSRETQTSHMHLYESVVKRDIPPFCPQLPHKETIPIVDPSENNTDGNYINDRHIRK